MRLVPPSPGPKPDSVRQLHFIDIDNLTAGPTTDLRSHRIVRQWYTTCTNMHDDDLCFVACSHHSGFAVATVWSDAKVYWRSGENGADYALLDAISETNFEGVNQVWVASGDGIFIPGIEALHAMRTGPEQIDVSVLALDDSMVHGTLPLAADQVVTIAAAYGSNMLGLAS